MGFSGGGKMIPIKKSVCQKRRGVVLIAAMIFLVIFSSLIFSLAAISAVNAQIASNQCKADGARACAESGLEVIRFWLSTISIPGDTEPGQKFYQIASLLQNTLAANNITNITVIPDDDGSKITIPSVTLDSQKGQTFSAQITPLPSASNPDTLKLDVTGVYGSISKNISVNYDFAERADTVFDFGVATKGPLSLAGNIELSGVNVAVESSVYIESENSNLALSIIGNSQIAGDVSVVNPVANVVLQGGKASIGGETGQDAIDNHVSFGVPPTEFPIPDPGHFEQYVTNVIDSSTDTTADATFENVRIAAGTNPTFSGHVTLKGIVFIETPNIVTFTGGTDITGIIVGDGDYHDDSGANQITFAGNVDSKPVSELPDTPEFAAIKQETGTFLLAPGFFTSFGGSFETLNGAIAANGVQFFGNAGGTIHGSVINYSESSMILTGNSDLFFNRSGVTEVPAGFVPEIMLKYRPDSYAL